MKFSIDSGIPGIGMKDYLDVIKILVHISEQILLLCLACSLLQFLMFLALM